MKAPSRSRHVTGPEAELNPQRAQRLRAVRATIHTESGLREVLIDEGESPLAWLARRKGRDGQAMIGPAQFQAGERLRADFTRAQMMARTTANWTSPVAQAGRGSGTGGPSDFTDAVVAARQSVQRALAATGPEFSGLLLDVCCFLKGLEDVERERGWPPRSAKVVLQLGLDRLARHFGYSAAARGPHQAPVRTWLAPGASFVVDSE